MTINGLLFGSAFFGELDNFINYASDENVNDKDFERLLIIASGRDHFNIVQYILNWTQIRADVRNNEALVRAVDNGNLKMCQLLIEKDADPSARNYLPLGLAIKNEDQPMIDILKKSPKLKNFDIETFISNIQSN